MPDPPIATGAADPAATPTPAADTPPQVPAPSPPSTSLTNSMLNQGQVAVQLVTSDSYLQGRAPATVGGSVTVGLPAFGDKNDHGVQLGVTETNTGAAAQLQGVVHITPKGHDQNTVLASVQVGMNPKLAAQLGINFEFDRGGEDANHPMYQHVVQVYGIQDENAQIGSSPGTGTTVGGSYLDQHNYGINQNNLNPDLNLGVEVKIQGTHLDRQSVDQVLGTIGVVGAYNVTLDGGKTVFSVGAGAYVGAEGHQGSGPNLVAGGGVSVGFAFGGTDSPKPSPDDSKPKIVETTDRGFISSVDEQHDKIVLDTGEGHTREFTLSQLKKNSPDPNVTAEMTRGERIDVVTHGDQSFVSIDYGRDDDWRKDQLVKRAQALPNGDLKIDNLTIRGDDAQLYKRWLANPEAKGNDVLTELEQKAAAKDPQVIGDVAQPAVPDFTRGSTNLPNLSVHMGGDGKGADRSAGLTLTNCTLTSMEDKGGVTTIRYSTGGHAMVMSVPDTVGGYAKDPTNPAGDKSIDGALARGDVSEQARNAAFAGTKNLIRDLDANPGPVPLVSPKGTKSEDLLKRMNFDPNTFDVHIGNLTIKKDAAAYMIQTIGNKGAGNPEMIAQLERLADSPSPTTIDQAKLRDAALKERDARGFGEPPNPIKSAFEQVKDGEKFDFSISRNGDAKLVNQTERLETQIHRDGADPPQPVAPQHQAPSHAMVHERR